MANYGYNRTDRGGFRDIPHFNGAFSARCENCVHGYDANDSDCAACLGDCDMSRHYRREMSGWKDLTDMDEEEWL